jgi:DNA-binding PadR family transcriptional regulator
MKKEKPRTDPRPSYQSIKVLNSFLSSPARELSGADLLSFAGIPSGTLYPILIRFEEAGWLTSRWEKRHAGLQGRPVRKLYRITGAGAAKAAALREEFLGGLAT